MYSRSFIIKGNHTSLDVSLNKPPLPLLIKAYYRFVKPILLRPYSDCNLQHVLNKTDLYYLRTRNTKALLVPNGVDIIKYRKANKFPKFTVLFLGRLDFQKGSDRLDRIFKSVDIPQGNYDVIVAGYGPYDKRIKKRAKSNFTFVGYVSEERKLELLARSHVLLFPSRFETFGFVVVEALASFTPVVSFDIAGVKDIISNGYNGFLGNNCSEIGRYIEHLYSIFRSERYNEIAQNARHSSEKFSWDIIMGQLLSMIKNVSN